MRLLLTRPAEEAAQTTERLAALGHDALISPVIDIVGLGAPWPAGVVDAILATSGQAFVALEADFGVSPETRRLLPSYFVGHRTAERARERGFLGPQTVARDAAALVVVLERLTTKPARLVYLAGRVRKPDIESALAVNGMHVVVTEVYDARPAAALRPDIADALRSKKIDGVLHFSRRSAALFIELAQAADAAFASLTHFCLSEDVTAPLREAGCTTIEVAEAPNEAALLALVDQA